MSKKFPRPASRLSKAGHISLAIGVGERTGAGKCILYTICNVQYAVFLSFAGGEKLYTVYCIVYGVYKERSQVNNFGSRGVFALGCSSNRI